MQYISGIHALNIECKLNTCGDWHTSALRWKDVKTKESSNSVLEDWGIETNKKIPEHNELVNVANHLRAILDIMIDGNVGYLKGFRNDFLCTDEYNKILFDKVYKLKELQHWTELDKLMQAEFMWDWDEYKEDCDNGRLERNAP